ncbi:hypothetical protein ACLM5J_09675 [Nocardioides sp. Bht2]|uniref:hypothetical protein n=1 Tax=Nocardioides sp. Bht2 TaxID=3392297 RepID=UPI0039B429F9
MHSIEHVFYRGGVVNSRQPTPFQARLTAPTHVWVDLTPDKVSRSAGLLTMWRQGREGWEGYVIWADWQPAHEGQTVRQGWVAAGMIEVAK